MRRIFWTALGLGAGAAAAVLTSRWARRKRQAISPANLGRQVSEGFSDLGRLLRSAVEDGRRAMAEKEAEIRSSFEE
jgi:hypothetical protein